MIGDRFLSRFRPSGRLLGVDLGSSHLKISRLKGDKNGLEADELIYAKLPPGVDGRYPPDADTCASFLRDIVHSRQLQNAAVSSILSDPSLTVTYMTIPWMPEGELMEGVKFELKKQVAFPTEEIVFDYLITQGEPREKSLLRMIVFAVERRAVDEHIGLLKSADLLPLAIDTVPTAVASCWNLVGMAKPRKNYALIDVGAANTTVSVLKGNKLVFARGIPFGATNLHQPLVGSFGLEASTAEEVVQRVGLLPDSSERLEGDPPAREVAEALRTELDEPFAEFHRTLDYFRVQFREDEIEGVCLTGGLALLPGLTKALGDFLGVECIVMNPLQPIRLPGTAEEISVLKRISPVFAASVGQATRRIGECGKESTSSLGSLSSRLSSRLSSYFTRVSGR